MKSQRDSGIAKTRLGVSGLTNPLCLFWMEKGKQEQYPCQQAPGQGFRGIWGHLLVSRTLLTSTTLCEF